MNRKRFCVKYLLLTGMLPDIAEMDGKEYSLSAFGKRVNTEPVAPPDRGVLCFSGTNSDIVQGRLGTLKNDGRAGKGKKAMTPEEVVEPLYPCQFPIKVIGENNQALEKIIIQAMASLGEVVDPDEMTSKLSKEGKYLSITFHMVVHSREHLQGIYSKLIAQKEVKIVL